MQKIHVAYSFCPQTVGETGHEWQVLEFVHAACRVPFLFDEWLRVQRRSCVSFSPPSTCLQPTSVEEDMGSWYYTSVNGRSVLPVPFCNSQASLVRGLRGGGSHPYVSIITLLFYQSARCAYVSVGDQIKSDIFFSCIFLFIYFCFSKNV